jgi:hypothetical protein
MRNRGHIGHVMTEEAVTGPVDSYALFVRPDGRMLMVHSEGVGYEVTEEKPWRWTDYGNCEVFPPHAMLALRTGAKEVDLADWVRTFGARLENNFRQISWWLDDVEAH